MAVAGLPSSGPAETGPPVPGSSGSGPGPRFAAQPAAILGSQISYSTNFGRISCDEKYLLHMVQKVNDINHNFFSDHKKNSTEVGAKSQPKHKSQKQT